MRLRRRVLEIRTADHLEGESWRPALARLRLRAAKHLYLAIVTPDEHVATAVREVTGGVGAPVVLAEPDASLPRPPVISERRFIATPPDGPAILLLASAVKGMGGIARYEWFMATSALDLGQRARITAIWRHGVVPGRGVDRWLAVRYTAKALAGALFNRPSAVVVSHLRLSPVAHLIKRIFHIPYAVTLHGDDAWWSSYDARTTAALKAADLLIPVSHFTRDVVAHNLGIEKERFYVTGSILSPDLQREAEEQPAYSAVDEEGEGERRIELLTVARLDANAPYKRHDLVIRAVAKLAPRYQGLEYNVIGVGEYKPELEQLAEELGVSDRVHFLGRISEGELAERYRNAYAFTMPSRISLDPPAGEGLGLVYLEAGIFGVPSVAARAGGSEETVLDGVTGLLAEPDSGESLEEAFVQLFDDPALRDRLGKAAIVRAREFDYPSFRRRCSAVLEYLLNGTPPKESEPEFNRTELALQPLAAGDGIETSP